MFLRVISHNLSNDAIETGSDVPILGSALRQQWWRLDIQSGCVMSDEQ